MAETGDGTQGLAKKSTPVSNPLLPHGEKGEVGRPEAQNERRNAGASQKTYRCTVHKHPARLPTCGARSPTAWVRGRPARLSTRDNHRRTTGVCGSRHASHPRRAFPHCLGARASRPPVHPRQPSPHHRGVRASRHASHPRRAFPHRLGARASRPPARPRRSTASLTEHHRRRCCARLQLSPHRPYMHHPPALASALWVRRTRPG